jgi:hypothetical protein
MSVAVLWDALEREPINFAAIWSTAQDDVEQDVPGGPYRLRLEFVQVDPRALLRIRWRVVDGTYAGRTIVSIWRAKDLPGILPGLGIPREVYSRVETLEGLVPLLEGTTVSAHVAAKPGIGQKTVYQVLGASKVRASESVVLYG